MCEPAECPCCTHPHSRGLLLRGGTHSTWQCPKMRTVWRWLSKQWLTLTGEHLHLIHTSTMCTGLADAKFPHQWRLLCQATHHFMWLAWCKWAHEQTMCTHHSIISTIITCVGDHMAALHHNAIARRKAGKASPQSIQLLWSNSLNSTGATRRSLMRAPHHVLRKRHKEPASSPL